MQEYPCKTEGDREVDPLEETSFDQELKAVLQEEE